MDESAFGLSFWIAVVEVPVLFALAAWIGATGRRAGEKAAALHGRIDGVKDAYLRLDHYRRDHDLLMAQLTGIRQSIHDLRNLIMQRGLS